MKRLLLIALLSFQIAIVRSEDESPVDHLQEGVYHELYTGDLKKAIAHFEKAVAHEKAEPKLKCRAMIGMANCYMRTDKVNEGLALMKDALAKYPKHAKKCLANKPITWELRQAFERKKRKGVHYGAIPGYVPLDERFQRKLEDITLNKVAFLNTPISVVFAFVKKQSQHGDPEGEGVDFVIIGKPILPTRQAGVERKEDDTEPEPLITLDLDNASLLTIVKSVCEQSGYRYRVDDDVVVVMAPGATQSEFSTRLFSASPQWIAAARREHAARAKTPFSFKVYFQNLGVTFPKAANGDPALITYVRSQNELVVKNTFENLRKIDRLLKKLNRTPATASFKLELLDLNVGAALLKQVRPEELTRFIRQLPERRRKVMEVVEVRGQHGSDPCYSKESIGRVFGKESRIRHTINAATMVDCDNLTVQLNLDWSFKVLAKTKATTGEGALFAVSLKQKFSLWDGETACIKIANADVEGRHGQLYLLVTPTLVDPASWPIRNPRTPPGGWLAVPK